MKKFKSVHTGRTIMFDELEKVMDFSIDSNDFLESLEDNVFGKKSASSINFTKSYLKKLYGFDLSYQPFLAFKYFWEITEAEEKPLLAFMYAINQDDILYQSIEVVEGVKIGEEFDKKLLEDLIEENYPNKYSINTRKSISRNITSSWKQAGFIDGRVKTTRVQPEIGFRVACFAFFLAYLNGDRGEFILNSTVVKSLFLPESRLRELAIECSRNDLMQYQYAGEVTSISFTNLLNKIGIDANTN